MCAQCTRRATEQQEALALALSAFCSVSSCCATTLSTSTSMRLNSSKHAHAPCTAGRSSGTCSCSVQVQYCARLPACPGVPHRLREPGEEAAEQAVVHVCAAVEHDAVDAQGAAEVLACLGLAGARRTCSSRRSPSGLPADVNSDCASCHQRCQAARAAPLAAPPSFMCSALVSVMKQRFTMGVQISRSGAPRNSYP